MTKTVFKNIRAHTTEYRRVMRKMGECMSNGGRVDLNHYFKDHRDKNGHLVRVEFIDVTMMSV